MSRTQQVAAGRFPNFVDPAAACASFQLCLSDRPDLQKGAEGAVLARLTAEAPTRFMREQVFHGVPIADVAAEVQEWAAGQGFALDAAGWDVSIGGCWWGSCTKA